MTQEEINANNILIAEFMEFKKGMLGEYTNPLDKPSKDGFVPIYFPSGSDMEFNSNWSWIMPVVEKIKELKHPVYIYQSHIQNTVEIFRLNDSSSYIIRKSSTKEKPIDLVWSAVVEFIKWYNAHKK